MISKDGQEEGGRFTDDRGGGICKDLQTIQEKMFGFFWLS